MNRIKKQDGFVSLLTCIIISLLLLVLTISLASIEDLQLVKAEDSEQSIRAYYTAEAGVEDAVSKVLSGTITPTLDDDVCNQDLTYDVPGDAGWTCQQVSFMGSPQGKLTTPDQAVSISPGKTNPAYGSVLIEWDQSPDANAAMYNVNLGGGFPSQAAYVASYAPAPIELSIVEYPNGGFSSNQVCNGHGQPAGCAVTLENAVLVPGGGASGLVNYSTTNAFTQNGPFKANCAPREATGAPGFAGKTGYNCYAILSGLNTGNDYLFRLRSLYAASSYRLTFYSGNDGNGSVVPIPTGEALIDVTAKAGQAYRRVIYDMPLEDGAASGLNYVMYSDTNICKNFDVINNVAQAGCPY